MPEAALAGFRVVFWRGYVGGRTKPNLKCTKRARASNYRVSGAP